MRKLTVAFVLVLAACAGGEADNETEADTPDVTTATEQNAPETQAPAEEPADEPADEPPAAGGVAITVTIGDETWEFPGTQCAYKNAPAGDAGSEWNVTNVDSRLQVYIADDEFGTLVSVADIENGANPTVYWEAAFDDVEITVNGDEITASGTFTDGVNGGTAEGTLTATCLDWFDAS